MIWKPTISPNDPRSIVQLKTLLGEIVDQLNRQNVEADDVTTSISDSVISALQQNPDWVRVTSAEAGVAYTTDLYRGKVWVMANQLDGVTAGTGYDTGYDDELIRFMGAPPSTLTGLSSFQAVCHREDVSAAQDGSDIENVWVVAPFLPWSTGSYVMVMQGAELVRLTVPATGTYFLVSIAGTMSWVEAGTC